MIPLYHFTKKILIVILGVAHPEPFICPSRGPKIAIVEGFTKFLSELEHNNIIYCYCLNFQTYLNGNQPKIPKWLGS